jgi:hypothetical protein
MSTGPLPSPSRYQVHPSGRVSRELKALIQRAASAGFGEQVIQALKTVHRMLSVYPQFGEPLRDLKMAGETVYVATIPPLYVEYVIDEPSRAVFIGVPFKVLPNVGYE